ncbi:caspase family protein [Bradyrhizobium sp. 157]|uniref:caspase family protein n=1 Tax=Bradyrhizobium sp. 157 TaxID=2782631 RepID=UPI001FF9B824|nr:caspase family protein [Bradyrhizobium sp. 157]MCK1642814.1 caspase family protein [Bradyrhizobium sp. 157]
MSRFKSLLLGAGLLAGLLNFAVTGAALAEAPNVDIRNGMQTPPADQRVALVIGNSNYQIAPKLANPGNDAQSMAQLLNSAGFEVTQATDLTRSDMVKVVQDFSAKVAERGPGTVAMIYYAGHGVQVAGENYLLPVDAKIASPSDLDGNSVRLVDVMGTLESIPSRMRIVVLDACRNNPFPEINDAGRGLAIVDAPRGSIVGYSTAPGMEAQDGDGNHSPYTSAFLNVAREPNLPIEQLFKRVRLEVNNTTSGKQTPWESSSLTSDFYFFGDTAVAAGRAPDRRPIVQTAANLPSRSVRQAYDYVLSEGSPEYYEEFIRLYPHDPLCDHIRLLLGNLRMATAWHKAVVANSPFAYKTFHDNYSHSPYAKAALKLQVAPKAVPLMQFTHLAKQSQTFKPGNIGNSATLGISKGNLNGHLGAHGHMPVPSKIVTLPAKGVSPITPASGGNNNGNPGKITTLPGKIKPAPINAGNPGKVTTLPGKINANPVNNGNTGKVTTLPGRINSNPVRVVNKPTITNRPVITNTPRHFSGGMGGRTFSPRFAASPSRSSFGGMGSFRR